MGVVRPDCSELHAVKFLNVRPSWDSLAVLHQQMREQIARLIESDIEARAIDARVAGNFPLMNVYETADAYHIHAEVPGLSADDLELDIGEDGISLECNRVWPDGTKEEHFRRQERWHGKSRRELSLSKRINPDEVSADLYAGVLTIRLPKIEPAKRRRIDVTSR